MRLLTLGLICLIAAPHVVAADYTMPSYNLSGAPGLIDMPTAETPEDGELSITNGYFAGTNRTALSFQITPRLGGTFRYTRIDDLTGPGTMAGYDRSFDLRFRVLDEGRYLPSVTIGLQDFIGTGRYSGEYVVASKTLFDRVTATAGLGWGRFATAGGFSNPLGVLGGYFDNRPTSGPATGGQANFNRWFRGNAAFFGGIELRATDRLTLMAEYSSDAYTNETANGLFTRRSPFNFGATYRARQGVTLGAYYMYGDTVGASISFTLNPKRPNEFPGGVGPAPFPVVPRGPGADFGTAWTRQEGGQKILRDNIQAFLDNEGLVLESLAVTATSAEVRVRNDRYGSSAQAVGRVARVLSATLPASVKTFVIVPVVRGMAVSKVTLRRSDIEALEHAPDGAWQSFVRADISDALPLAPGAVYRDPVYPKFTWGLGPYGELATFDPTNPLLFDVGLQLKARFEAAPGIVISGRARQSVYGTLNQSTRVSDSIIQRVRSDANIYGRMSGTEITDLIVAGYFRPGRNLYGRITAGYLEAMYGGISAELLWKPVTSNIALGVEVNYVKQRSFNQLLGFQAYEVVTGHVSAYWNMGNGFHAQLDAGRYLAGDWGATLTLDREFRNGWKVGAFATFTTVSFNDFGEGSFDKGLRFTIPLETLTGRPSRTKITSTLRPVLRDGGARVNVNDRLYEMVREYHQPGMQDQWGRFWR